jgi:hypothetical protein
VTLSLCVTNLVITYSGVIILTCTGVIGEVRCSFLRIYAPTPYSADFQLHAPEPAPIKIVFGAVRCGLVPCGVSAVLRFRLNSFGSD